MLIKVLWLVVDATWPYLSTYVVGDDADER